MLEETGTSKSSSEPCNKCVNRRKNRFPCKQRAGYLMVKVRIWEDKGLMKVRPSDEDEPFYGENSTCTEKRDWLYHSLTLNNVEEALEYSMKWSLRLYPNSNIGKEMQDCYCSAQRQNEWSDLKWHASQPSAGSLMARSWQEAPTSASAKDVMRWIVDGGHTPRWMLGVWDGSRPEPGHAQPGEVDG